MVFLDTHCFVDVLQVRAGYIVPLQQPAMTTGEVRASPLTLVVALQQQVR